MQDTFYSVKYIFRRRDAENEKKEYRGKFPGSPAVLCRQLSAFMSSAILFSASQRLCVENITE